MTIKLKPLEKNRSINKRKSLIKSKINTIIEVEENNTDEDSKVLDKGKQVEEKKDEKQKSSNDSTPINKSEQNVVILEKEECKQ